LRLARATTKKQPSYINQMKTFFIKTRIFWIITRILFIALYIGAAINDIKSAIWISLLFFTISAIMIYVSTVEFLNKDRFLPGKIIVGVFSIFLGVTMAGLLFYSGIVQSTELFLFLFPLWVILYGLWEIYSTKDRESV